MIHALGKLNDGGTVSELRAAVSIVLNTFCWLNMQKGLRQIARENPSRSFMYMS
jgi:hypothetical protein